MFGIFYDNPFLPVQSQVVTDALSTYSLDAQLHQVMGDLGRLALDLAAKADHKVDNLAGNLFYLRIGREENERQVMPIGKGERLLAQGLAGGCAYRYSGYARLVEAI